VVSCGSEARRLAYSRQDKWNIYLPKNVPFIFSFCEERLCLCVTSLVSLIVTRYTLFVLWRLQCIFGFDFVSVAIFNQNLCFNSRSVKDLDELYKQTKLLDPRTISPVQIARRRQKQGANLTRKLCSILKTYWCTLAIQCKKGGVMLHLVLLHCASSPICLDNRSRPLFCSIISTCFCLGHHWCTSLSFSCPLSKSHPMIFLAFLSSFVLELFLPLLF